MTKIMVLEPGPNFSVADVCRGWLGAFQELGCDARALNYAAITGSYMSFEIRREDNGEYIHTFTEEDAVRMASRQALAQAFQFWPDIVFIVSGFYVTPELLALFHTRNMKTVVLCTESPYEDDRQIHFAHQVDYVLLNDPTNIDVYRERNPNTFYVPHAYDPKIHHPGPPADDLICDFGFCGTGYPSRREFFEQVDWTDIDIKLAGYWKSSADSALADFVVHPIDYCFDNTEAVELYRSAKVSANLYRVEANEPDLVDGWAMGPHEVELAACQTFFLRSPRGEGDETLWMLPTFDTPDEFSDLLRWFLDHPGQRERLARSAQQAIHDRTFTTNAKWLLDKLKG